VIRIEAVIQVGNVHVFAQNASISNRDFLHRCQVHVPSDIDAISNSNGGVVHLSRIARDGKDQTVREYVGIIADLNRFAAAQFPWPLNGGTLAQVLQAPRSFQENVPFTRSEEAAQNLPSLSCHRLPFLLIG
jgi:hypothetical protein